MAKQKKELVITSDVYKSFKGAGYGAAFNALEDGWTIKKRNDKYIFSKHKGKVKEIMLNL